MGSSDTHIASSLGGWEAGKWGGVGKGVGAWKQRESRGAVSRGWKRVWATALLGTESLKLDPFLLLEWPNLAWGGGTNGPFCVCYRLSLWEALLAHREAQE